MTLGFELFISSEKSMSSLVVVDAAINHGHLSCQFSPFAPLIRDKSMSVTLSLEALSESRSCKGKHLSQDLEELTWQAPRESASLVRSSSRDRRSFPSGLQSQDLKDLDWICHRELFSLVQRPENRVAIQQLESHGCLARQVCQDLAQGVVCMLMTPRFAK
jgi:hypothetical protein